MALQKFVKTNKRSKEQSVAVWFRGQIGLNRVLVEKYNLEQYKKAVLFYDPEKKQMVFQFSSVESEGAVNVIYSKLHVGLISGKNYLDFFNIEHSKSVRYPAHYDEKTNMLALNISEGVVAADRVWTRRKGVVATEVTNEVATTA